MISIPNISSTFNPLTWIIMSGLFMTAGDLVFRNYLEHNWNYGFFVSLGIYFIATIFLCFSFFGENIAIATVIVFLFNISAYLTITFFAYGDTINIQQIAGLALGAVAIILLESGK